MKKIALIIDIEDWAFANIARNIKVKLENKYVIEIFPIMNYENNLINVLNACKDFDIIHFFWRGVLLDFNSDSYQYQLTQKNIDISDFNKKYLENKIITTCVQDHLFIDNETENTKKIFNTFENYYVSSKKLFNIYTNLEIDNKPSTIIHDGVDLGKFYLKDKTKFEFENVKDRKIVIGWVGNSAWHSNEEDFKGYNTIIKPVVEELIKEGYPIELKVADKQEKIIPHDEMPDYYSNIDILLCASKVEGTPCPVIEAMACGNIVISTDVGVVPEAFGKMQKKLILKKREKNELRNKILYLLENRELLKELSDENQIRIKNWSWNKIAKDYDIFWENIMLKRDEDKMKEYEKILEELKRENRKIEILLKASKSENEYMKKNIKSINKKINNMKNSKTWKIVRKVAKIKKMFRRKK